MTYRKIENYQRVCVKSGRVVVDTLDDIVFPFRRVEQIVEYLLRH
jgi:hypothetical protein